MPGSTTDVAAARTRSWKLSKWGLRALVLSWLCVLWDGLFSQCGFWVLSWLMIPILLVAIIWHIVNGAFRPLLLIIILNPLGLMFIGGVVSYSLGNPKLHGGGWASFHRMDRKTHCFYRTDRGCTQMPGVGWYDELAHNTAIRLMVALFGYPRNAYAGPYPTAVEAIALVTNAPPTPVNLFAENKVLVDGVEVELDKGRSAWCLRLAGLDAKWFTNADNRQPTVRATLQQERCMILYIYDASAPAEDYSMREVVMLFDYQKMRPFFYQTCFPSDRFR